MKNFVVVAVLTFLFCGEINGQSNDSVGDFRIEGGVGMALSIPDSRHESRYGIPGTKFNIGAYYSLPIRHELDYSVGLQLNNMQYVHIFKNNGLRTLYNRNYCYSCAQLGVKQDPFYIGLKGMVAWQREQLSLGLNFKGYYFIGNYPRIEYEISEKQSNSEALITKIDIDRRIGVAIGSKVGYSTNNIELSFNVNFGLRKNIFFGYEYLSGIDSVNVNFSQGKYEFFNPKETIKYEKKLSVSNIALNLSFPLSKLKELQFAEGRKSQTSIKLVYRDLNRILYTLYYEGLILDRELFDLKYGVGMGASPTLGRGWSFNDFNVGTYFRVIAGNRINTFLDLNLSECP